MRCSPIGLVAKKAGGYRLITHLLHPPGLSVNEHIDDAFASVKYTNFDNAVTMIKTFGTGCLIGTMDIKSAFIGYCHAIMVILICSVSNFRTITSLSKWPQ